MTAANDRTSLIALRVISKIGLLQQEGQDGIFCRVVEHGQNILLEVFGEHVGIKKMSINISSPTQADIHALNAIHAGIHEDLEALRKVA